MLSERERTTLPVSAASVRLRWVYAVVHTVASFTRRKPLGAAGAVVLAVMVVLAVIAPVVAPFDPKFVYVKFKYSSPGTTCDLPKVCLEKTGQRFWLGNDLLGRDALSRLIFGARISLYVSLASVALGVGIGGLLGIISAYSGGIFDLIVQRLVDALMAFPALILALLIVAIWGASLKNVILALIMILLPGSARVLRSQALAIKEMDYMLAGRALGAGPMRLILRHMLPNCLAPMIVFATANLGFAIVVEASLSFLGLGTPPDVPSWGGMLAYAGQKFVEVAPWQVVFPGIAVSVAVFGFNLFGDALRDVLDPRLRGTGT